MSLHLFEQFTYSEDDWYIMQDAHLKACELLGLDPVSYKNADRLARTIMNIFDGGARDFQIIASIAAHREAMLDRQFATYH
ncbi:hypothetical protein [Phyllobacterium bourgognense]|uniref:Uncharacterized protein n=1 Tax=Phyllobacterium bourgognense TaxID=314236 RepID=A0A368YE57_9HYPH|nr:hypothetical protein [Phyllobacterium bourgognense]RCW77718.1 hypothetical protein C7476_13925 [Phyllobacterium bourgognense]